MSLLDAFLNQKATWWQKISVDSAGDSLYAAPLVISVYWVNKDQTVLNQDGEEQRTRSEVRHLQRAMRPGDFILLGESTDAAPNAVNALHVHAINDSPSTDGTDFVMRAFV